MTAAVLFFRPALVATRGASLPAARHALAPAPAQRVVPVRFTVVRSGDTLGAIAQRFRTTVTTLLALNPGIDPRALHAGQRISLP